MTIREIIDLERPPHSCGDPIHADVVNAMLDRIELAVSERIAALEARVDGYERLLDEAYDEYLSGCTADELHDILKEVLEYAPRRNWEEK